MKAILGLAALLVVSVCVALGVAVFSGDDAPDVLLAGAGATAGPAAGVAPVDEAAARRLQARAPAVRSEQPPELPKARAGLSLDELRAALEACALDAATPPHRYRDLLRRLVDMGTEESVGLVIEYLQRPVFESAQRANMFFSLLEEVQDERIFPAARMVLERNLNAGHSLWPQTYGYLNLMAASGGVAAADELFRLLEDERGQVAHGAMQAIGRLADHSTADRFLRAMVTSDKPALQRELALGLAAWREEAVTERLQSMAFDQSIDAETRRVIGKAVARNLTGEAAGPFMERYWSATDASDRTLVLSSLGSIGRETGVHPRELVERVTPILADALGDSSEAVWRSAVMACGDHREYHTPKLASALQALLLGLERETDRRQVERTLERVMRTLER